MEVRTTYKGTYKGAYGIYCGFKPKGMRNPEEIDVYYPDEGKIFVKDGESFSVVILKENENIEDYSEEEIEEKDNGE